MSRVDLILNVKRLALRNDRPISGACVPRAWGPTPTSKFLRLLEAAALLRS